MKEKLISVIMCAYNESEMEFGQAVKSILNQTYVMFELIIVLDNPQNDILLKEAYKYADSDSRIRVLKNEKNIGVTQSTNHAIIQARGELIAKMDADDIAMPLRLQREVEVLNRHKLDLVAASKKNIDECGRSLGDFVNEVHPEQMFQLLPFDNLINQSTVLMKKEVLMELGGYRELPSCEDYDLWLRMLGNGYRMEILPDILEHYRVRSNSITRTDYYKQYISECFIRDMYQEYEKTSAEYWTLEIFEQYKKRYKLDADTRDRFNQAYRMYYKSMESRKMGKGFLGLCLFWKAICRDPQIMGIFVRKLKFHIRKTKLLSKNGR